MPSPPAPLPEGEGRLLAACPAAPADRGTCWSTSRNSGPGARPLGGMCCVNSAIKSSGARSW